MSGAMVCVGCNSTKDRSPIRNVKLELRPRLERAVGGKYGLRGPSDNVNRKKKKKLRRTGGDVFNVCP